MKRTVGLKLGFLLAFLATGGKAAYAVEPWRLAFNETNVVDSLTFVGSARVVELSDQNRQGVLFLEDSNDKLDVVPNTLDLGLQSQDFTLSLMFRHDPLPASGAGAYDSMVLFDSDSATIALNRGSGGGNAGKIYATLLTDQGNVLFKPEVRVDDGRWHVLTLRGDSASNLVQVFLDGVLHPDRNYSGTAMIFNNSRSFSIGSGAGTMVDEIHVFNQALSDTEVMSDHYAAICGMGGPAGGVDRIRICIPAGQTNRCDRYADIFSQHVVERAFGVQVSVENQYTAVTPVENELVIYPGVADADPESQSVFLQAFGSLPDADSPGSEGFSLKMIAAGDGYKAWVAGVDERGVLYGLGRLLHLSKITGPWLAWNAPFNEESAPQYAIRGMGISEKYSMDPSAAAVTGARSWTLEEGVFQWEEHLLLGANTFTHGRGRIPPVNMDLYISSGGTAGISLDRDARCVDYGVNYYGSQAVNAVGSDNMEPGWNATTFVGTLDPHLGCPSIPAARAMMVDLWEVYAEEAEKLEYVNLKSGDPGGCYSAACQSNWPAIFYDLCCDIADAIHVWKPDAKVYFTNQEMDADDNEALFTLIHEDPDSPLAGYSYAPGGSENSTYGYNVINPVWEQMYPDIDPDSTFLYSRLGYLQPGQDVLAMPDVTHWKRAASAVQYPDPVWTETFDRRTYNARPAAYDNVFWEQMSYCTGMIGYSEGLFDDFNKYMLLRKLWEPGLTSTNLALEYYTYYCGGEAAEPLAEAAFLGEQIMEQPFFVSREQGDVQQFYELIQQADACMPVEYREGNWRYAEMRQRALIFQYVLQRYNKLEEKYSDAQDMLHAGISNGTSSSAIGEALDILDLSNLTATASSGFLFALTSLPASSVLNIPLDELFAEAEALDDEIDEAIAIRELALTKIDAMDEVGVYWLADQIESIQTGETNESAKASRLSDVLDYDQVDPGEFYDNCGTVERQPHYVSNSGELYYGSGGWPQETRPSQRWYNYSFEAQPGLEFSYEGLDTNVAYEVTMTWPNPGQLSFSMNSPNEFYIYADNELVGQVLPPNEVSRFTFTIPRFVTADGEVRVKIRKVPDNARCTCISEIWLRKKPSNGLVASWDFHDETYADQIGSLDGTAHGSVAVVDSGRTEFSKAIQLGSVKGTDYLEMGDLSALGIYTNSFTVSFWVKHSPLPESPDSPEIWDSKTGNSSVGYDGMQVVIQRGNDGGNAGKVYASVGGASLPEMMLLKGTPRIDDGDWHWIVVRYDGETDEMIYLQDGIHIEAEDEERIFSLNQWPSGKQLRIGDGFGGLIGDVRVYDTALSFEELDGLY